ncbi:MAG: DUF4040 domain-containing protein [Clostridiales bacterium]|nr:DUF4040 domain-containing protein [Clostridiales bacterium]
MDILRIVLLASLIICAISVSLSRNLLTSVVIYMAFSLTMTSIWLLLESPDLAITEAAVGAGVTSILFFVTLRKIHSIQTEAAEEIEEIEEKEEDHEQAESKL